MPSLSRLLLLIQIALACALPPRALAAAAPYPTRTIKIIIPTAVGGAGDTLARYLGDRLAASLRTPVVIRIGPAPAD